MAHEKFIRINCNQNLIFRLRRKTLKNEIEKKTVNWIELPWSFERDIIEIMYTAMYFQALRYMSIV